MGEEDIMNWNYFIEKVRTEYRKMDITGMGLDKAEK